VRHKPSNPLRKEDWRVDTCSLEQAYTLVKRLHYAAGSANTATFRHGLYRNEEWPFVVAGCALWMPPTRKAAEASLRSASMDDGCWRQVLTLSRLVIEPDVPTNAASFLISRSEKLIRQDGRWLLLVTYADEWQGHTGAIYRASGWEYVGTTQPALAYVVNGRMLSRKAGPKTRTHQEMLDMGAEVRGPFRKHKFMKTLKPAVRESKQEVWQ